MAKEPMTMDTHTKEELQQLAQKEKEDRATECLEKINEVLQETSCDIIPTYEFIGAQVKPGWFVIAK
jgi:hypothetical protein